MISLTATVVEIAPQDGYSIVRFQLAGVDGGATSGDCFGVAVDNAIAEDYQVGNVYQISL